MRILQFPGNRPDPGRGDFLETQNPHCDGSSYTTELTFGLGYTFFFFWLEINSCDLQEVEFNWNYNIFLHEIEILVWPTALAINQQ